MDEEKRSGARGVVAAIPVALILAAAAARLVPHPPNMTPMPAIALFGAWQYGWRGWWKGVLSVGLPLAALFLSDLALNNLVYRMGGESGGLVWFYPGAGWTYLSMALVVGWGWLALKRFSAVRLAGTSVVGSLLFFAVSNFGVWASFDMYPHTAAGLMECYVAGIPFLGNALLGDLLFTGLLFGAFWLATKGVTARQTAQA